VTTFAPGTRGLGSRSFSGSAGAAAAIWAAAHFADAPISASDARVQQIIHRLRVIVGFSVRS